VPTVAFVDTGARLQGAPPYRVVSDVETAAAEVDRLFADEAYWQSASKRCREYFCSAHTVSPVMAIYGGLVRELLQEPPRAR
jgi:hypothetical protein